MKMNEISQGWPSKSALVTFFPLRSVKVKSSMPDLFQGGDGIVICFVEAALGDSSSESTSAAGALASFVTCCF